VPNRGKPASLYHAQWASTCRPLMFTRTRLVALVHTAHEMVSGLGGNGDDCRSGRGRWSKSRPVLPEGRAQPRSLTRKYFTTPSDWRDRREELHRPCEHAIDPGDSGSEIIATEDGATTRRKRPAAWSMVFGARSGHWVGGANCAMIPRISGSIVSPCFVPTGATYRPDSKRSLEDSRASKAENTAGI